MPRAPVPHPTATALAAWLRLLQEAQDREVLFPSERELARRWGLSISAVNRATHRLIAQGRLRRDGYRLYSVLASRPAAATAPFIVCVLHEHNGLNAHFREEARGSGLTLHEKTYEARDAFLGHLAELRRRPPPILLLDHPETTPIPYDDLHALIAAGTTAVFFDEAPPPFNLVAVDSAREVVTAAEHLASLGHRQIALLMPFPGYVDGETRIAAWQSTCTRLRLGASASRVLWYGRDNESFLDVFARHQREFASVTALTCLGASHAPLLARELARNGTPIPDRFSVIAVGYTEDAVHTRPALTEVATPPQVHVRLAVEQAIRLHTERTTRGMLPPPFRLRLESTLTVRASTARRSSRAPLTPQKPATTQPAAAQAWPVDRARRIALAATLARRPYPAVDHASPDEFITIGLGEAANRYHDHARGWIAHFPLRHFPPGLRVIHGVPFQFAVGTPPGRTILVLRSAIHHQGAGTPLPRSVDLPIGRRVSALYLLHACAWAQPADHFADYELSFADGRTQTVPLVSAGWPTSAEGAPPPAASIQDWWYTFPRLETTHVRPVPITAEGDPFLYERYLYTLEIPVTDSSADLTFLTVRTRRESRTTLALLAITARLAPPG